MEYKYGSFTKEEIKQITPGQQISPHCPETAGDDYLPAVPQPQNASSCLPDVRVL
jgi:hypothetical protein